MHGKVRGKEGRREGGREGGLTEGDEAAFVGGNVLVPEPVDARD